MNVVGVENYEEAEIAAKEMAAKGCKAIELCAGFGYEGVARVKKAVGPDIAVGAVKFDCHPAFGYKSGDEIDVYKRQVLVCAGLRHPAEAY